MIIFESISRYRYRVYDSDYYPDCAYYYKTAGNHINYVKVYKLHIPRSLQNRFYDYYRIIPDIFMMNVYADEGHLQPEAAIILSAKHLSKHALANDGLPPELICVDRLKVLITCVDISRKHNMPKLERFEYNSNPGKLLYYIKVMQFDELLKPQTITKSAASYGR